LAAELLHADEERDRRTDRHGECNSSF